MDDLWANAWHEPAKQRPSDAETDIALPSWSTGAAVSWAEPSTNQATLWVSSEPVGMAWASPYDDISLGKLSSSVSPQVDCETPLPSTPPPEPTLEPKEPEIRSTIHTTPSPDAFGTFETVLKVDQPSLDPWAVGSAVLPSTVEREDVWIPSWAASYDEVKAEKTVDEWEEAKRQKARQDEQFPPEFLASILDDFKSLSSDLWPTQSPPEDHTRVRSGLESVEGLDSITNRLMPRDLTLSSSVQFSKTFIAKHLVDALRLSRHVPLTRLSPFTLYMASKGLTAWEISIKSRIDVTSDDLLPPGWRVVEKEREEPSPVVEMKKSGGGLLSFFGRKSANPPVEANPRRSESPGRPTSISISSNGTASSPVTRSTRPSLDSAKSSTHSSAPNLLVSSPVADSTLVASVLSSQITAPGTAEQTPQAPSAVSRFLGRFARNKTSGPSLKESLALSTDDLEFLSDIVPSANDEADENDQPKRLSDMLNRPSLSTALPPILAPPPRAPPTNFVSKNLTSLPSKLAAHPQGDQEDPFSIFDFPSTVSKPTTPATQPIIPSLPPSKLPNTSTPPLRSPTSSLYGGESQGVPSSSRFNGRSSSPFDTSALNARSQTPSSSGRRAPIAIMSTGSSSGSNSGSIATLPPAPILPPPPPTKFTSTPSHSRTSLQHNILEDDHDLVSFRASSVSQPSLLYDSNTSSVFSDQSIFSDTSSHQTKSSGSLFDDFDDFISPPIRGPSPPRPPAKPSPLNQAPEEPQQPPPQPSTKQPSPLRRSSRAADYQRTLSLVNLAASRTGRWPAPPSPLPELLSPPPGGPHASPTSITAAPLSSMQAQQKNAISAMASSTSPPSGLPLLIRPPPDFSGLQTSTTFPSPPRLGTASPAPMANLMQIGSEASRAPTPGSTAPKYTPSATLGELSAQDLSFFEGLQ